MSVTNGRLAKAEAALSAYYATLTPSERVRLSVAAGARGDIVEQGRIATAGRRIAMSVHEFMPLAQALGETDCNVYLELVALAADYVDAFHVASASDTTPQDDSAEDSTGADRAAVAASEADSERESASERLWQLVLDKGYRLRVMWQGWKLFCERRGVPSYESWEPMSGWERLQRALDLSSQASFTAEGQLRWLNRFRPTGEPEIAELWITPDTIADDLEARFRDRVADLGGEL
jgi:hypothetical protein